MYVYRAMSNKINGNESTSFGFIVKGIRRSRRSKKSLKEDEENQEHCLTTWENDGGNGVYTYIYMFEIAVM